MIVRPAHPLDADGIGRVHVASWQSTYAGLIDEGFLAKMSAKRHADNHRELMADPRTFYLVAEDRTDGIVGFVTGGPERQRDPDFTGEIYALYLLQHHQRKGLGQMLVQFSALRLRAMGHISLLIWVLSRNPAEGFYQHLGGKKLRSAPTTVGRQEVEEVAYVWPDTLPLL
jgi:GNAT superfamily N-acetyltransferase